MSYNFCPLDQTRKQEVYFSVDEINRHGTGLGAVGGTISTITLLLTETARSLLTGVSIGIAIAGIAQVIAYALTNHGIKGFDVTFHYKCTQQRAWDTDQWVEFTGWELINITVVNKY